MIRSRTVRGIAALVAATAIGGCAGTDAEAVAAPTTTGATTTISMPETTTTTGTEPAAPDTTTTAPTVAGGGPVALPVEADLYADPPTVTGMPPGRLVRYQPMPPLTGTDGAVAPGDRWRVMYTSTDHTGAPIVVTGVARVPNDRPAPAVGWPVISWAHGTTGTADRCAPSKHSDVAPVPDPLVADGFVVVATDYAGLGTPGLHPYFDGPGEGRAVLDIVAAAGELPGVVAGRRFALWGHSQGGHAVLFAREMAAERLPDRELVGTVALAPPSLVKDSMTAILVAMQPKGFAAMAVAGIASQYPDARLTDILTPAAASAIGQTVDTGCAREVDQAMSLFRADDIVVANPNQTEPWATYLQADEPAMAPGSGPLLVVHAADDRTVPAAMSAVVKERTCARGEPTLRWTPPSGGHNGIIADTLAHDRRWTLDRFAGVAPPSNCGQPDGPPPT